MSASIETLVRQIVDLSDDEINQVRPFLKTKFIKKGEYFVTANQIADEIAFVQKGLFRIHYLVHNRESIRYFGSEGTFITSLPSFTSRKPSLEYVQALEDSVILVLTYEDLQKMYTLSYKWERVVRILTEKTFNELQFRVYSLISQSAQERYESFFTQRPDLIQRIPQYLIANYLGISPETLSRIRRP
jgi:CRP-like cAMP-binding protein